MRPNFSFPSPPPPLLSITKKCPASVYKDSATYLARYPAVFLLTGYRYRGASFFNTLPNSRIRKKFLAQKRMVPVSSKKEEMTFSQRRCILPTRRHLSKRNGPFPIEIAFSKTRCMVPVAALKKCRLPKRDGPKFHDPKLGSAGREVYIATVHSSVYQYTISIFSGMFNQKSSKLPP